MKFTIIATGTHSIEWPIIQLIVNEQVCGQCEIREFTEADFDIKLDQPINSIELAWINKQEHHTVFDQDRIVQDQTITLCQVRMDDILLDSWFLTQGRYYPDYFYGFLQQCPDAPRELRSQLIWHFPGKFVFEKVPSRENFWLWYRDQRRYVHVKTWGNKDQHREEGYIGSYEPLSELIEEIERLIRV